MAVVQRSPLWEDGLSADRQGSTVVTRMRPLGRAMAQFSSVILIQLSLGRHYVDVVNSCHLSSL